MSAVEQKKPVVEASPADEPKKTHKRDVLRSFEPVAQSIWKKKRVFEQNAPTVDDCSADDGDAMRAFQEKFLVTFPYPYMNGRLHLGHAFTFTKAEFATGYMLLKGRRALFPFGLHCTGMPIKACADKLKREIELFGINFDAPQPLEEAVKSLSIESNEGAVAAAKKHSKVAAKTGNVTYQYEIMLSNGVPREEIHRFADPLQWLSYFPDLALKDIEALGCKNDTRRSFITTDVNPYYDSFVRWQMNKLYALGKIKFGERYTIYSPLDGQPCMDHDRQTGEGVGPQEYTGIKMEVAEWSANCAALSEQFAGKRVYLVAATFRPETMYGQTNCFVGTAIEYGFFEVNDTDVYVCTERAARNMCFQGFSKQKGVHVRLATVQGSDLIGTRVKAPLSIYKEVYVLPMDNVLPTKGTGVVTSVPSDSPDDCMALQDLKKKPDYYKIDPSWVATYDPVPIIRSPAYGDLTAPAICKEKKIQSQKDRIALAEAKDMAYKEGFYNGTMIVGDFVDAPVQEAKPKIREQLIAQGDAFIYNEPESLIMSRSGDECVVNLCDQWYLDYGETEWRAVTERCLSRLNTYGEETRHQFEHTIGWLNQWACARSFGLGTKLPWDPQFLVESLSDSTIYMAYYTVAHFLHGDTLDGHRPGPAGIRPDQMTDAVWEYLLGSGELPADTDIPADTLRAMRREFLYFYPMDLRVSGKDLIQNHLTFALYNHTALFPESQWPLGIRANGHLLLNRQKMSRFGADATRVALADAGDAIEDANFEDATANAAILRLFTLMEWIEEMLQPNAPLRDGPSDSFHDQVFANEMTRLIQLTDEAYSNFMFREALKNGFYEFQSARDWYREATAGEGMHRDLINKFIEAQTLMLAPVAPHWAEHVWSTLLHKDTSIMVACWPETPTKEADVALLDAADYVRKLLKRVRDLETSSQKKGKGKGKPAPAFDASKPKALAIMMAANFPEWQEAAIIIMKESFDRTTKQFDDVTIRRVLGERGLLKDKQMMPFVQEIKKRVAINGPSALDRAITFDEHETLKQVIKLFERALNYNEITISLAESIPAEDPLRRKADGAVPGEPTVHFWNI
ncbi:hypothetical protein BDF19DRAFT_450584 [Syncephalis fuscata]|nr:hypothetical protein BDF19DRAFT_450584 [Syncephalis fuscata]